jgi:hypothetical protein
VVNRTGKLIDVQGGYPHGTAYSLTINAWPKLDSIAAPATTNTNYVPDLWLTQRGLSVNAALSGTGGYHTNGYTHLENFLNGDSIVAPGTLNTCVSARRVNSINSGNWIDSKDSIYGYYNSPSYLISTDTMNVLASILDNGNYGSIAANYYTTGIIRRDINNHAYLNRNITLASSNTISNAVTLRFYFSAAEFNALKAADNTINTISDLVVLRTNANNCSVSMNTVPGVITPTATGNYGTYQAGYFLEFSTTSFGTFFIGSKSSFLQDAINATSSLTNISVCAATLPYSWNNNIFNAAGTYVVHLINAAGYDSAAKLVLNVISSPFSPSGTGGVRCGSGIDTLSAIPGSGETIDWYTAATGGTALLSGSNNFITPAINSTTVYYAQARNTATGCLSLARTPVTATVNICNITLTLKLFLQGYYIPSAARGGN